MLISNNPMKGTWSVSGGTYHETYHEKYIFDDSNKTYWHSNDWLNDWFEVEFHVCLFYL